MNIDWQATYYIIASISMTTIFFVALYLFFLTHQLYSKLKLSLDRFSELRLIAKIGILRTLLNIFR